MSAGIERRAYTVGGDAYWAFLNTNPRLIKHFLQDAAREVVGQLRYPHRCLASGSCA